MSEHENSSSSVKNGVKPDRKQFGGVPANAFVIPIVIVVAVLHLLIVTFIFAINSESGKLSQTMQSSNTYVTDATNLLAGSSLLCETSTNFILSPLINGSEPNVGPLTAYANEIAQPEHRGDQTAARFETYEVSDQVLDLIETAAQSADEIIEAQYHALALVTAVYPLPDIPPLAVLSLPELSAEEAALSNEAKLDLAHSIILSPEYAQNKQLVSANVNQAVGSIRASSGAQAEVTSQSVGTLRILLWVATIAVIMVLLLSFILLYRAFIFPIGRFSQLIIEDEPLDSQKGLSEMRLLAGSYNSLRNRRNALEEILREAAETDVLTGVPNRYSLERYLLDSGDSGYALAVLLFDVNNLKIMNDTYGHAAGDDLLRRAAACIADSFEFGGNGRCYRIGGDEFAVAAKDIEESAILEAAEPFQERQRLNDVSISWGYAYASEIGDTSFKELMREADQRMYTMKQESHRKKKEAGA